MPAPYIPACRPWGRSREPPRVPAATRAAGAHLRRLRARNREPAAPPRPWRNPSRGPGRAAAVGRGGREDVESARGLAHDFHPGGSRGGYIGVCPRGRSIGRVVGKVSHSVLPFTAYLALHDIALVRAGAE